MVLMSESEYERGKREDKKEIFDELDKSIIRYFSNPITYDIPKEKYNEIKNR